MIDGIIDYYSWSKAEIQAQLADYRKETRLNLLEFPEIKVKAEGQTNDELMAALEMSNEKKKQKKNKKKQQKIDLIEEVNAKKSEDDDMIEHFKQTLEQQAIDRSNAPKMKPVFSKAWINKLNSMF